MVHSSTRPVQIDEQDAEERAELRRKQIEAANKMLYDDTDRPKKLHSKMLLSDVMHERVAQMGYAQQIKALKHKQDAAFLVQQAARLKVMELKLTSSHSLAHFICTHSSPQSPTRSSTHPLALSREYEAQPLLPQVYVRHL